MLTSVANKRPLSGCLLSGRLAVGDQVAAYDPSTRPLGVATITSVAKVRARRISVHTVHHRLETRTDRAGS